MACLAAGCLFTDPPRDDRRLIIERGVGLGEQSGQVNQGIDFSKWKLEVTSRTRELVANNRTDFEEVKAEVLRLTADLEPRARAWPRAAESLGDRGRGRSFDQLRDEYIRKCFDQAVKGRLRNPAAP